jgi:RimJ/RimL family protein N-acetyltransferase
VRYGFEQLALHRISLGVLADNPRAVELYKHMCVTLCARSGELGLSALGARSGFVEKATFRKKNWQVRWVLR